MNPYIRERLTVQEPRIVHPSFRSAAAAWGDEILPGLACENEDI